MAAYGFFGFSGMNCCGAAACSSARIIRMVDTSRLLAVSISICAMILPLEILA